MQLSTAVIAKRVRQEIRVRGQQGYAINGHLEQWETVKSDRQSLIALQQEICALPIKEDWPYEEVSDLEAIRDRRPSTVALPVLYLAEDEIRNKIHGGWLGRAAGCILGKPFEVGLTSQEIKAYLQGANAYPFDNYVPAQSAYPKVLRRDCVPSMRGYVQYAQEDDDLNYMCLAVKLMEQHGVHFTTLDVGLNWLESIPFMWTWGPEHAVYLNLATAIGEHNPSDIDLEQVTGYFNPGTEWIGAQIRSDVYGYVSPNLPELAAEFAWRDAYLTHRSSGIYGSMWVAAMNAVAFVLLDMKSIILAGLAQIPENSRFSEAIRQTLEWVESDGDWERTGERICKHFDHYGYEGTINNACCVAAALLYGFGDGADDPATIYERTITTAVQLAYDTDCNGATAGSVIGVMLGATALPMKWMSPLNDSLRSCVVGFGAVSIAAMAARTYELSRIVRSSCLS